MQQGFFPAALMQTGTEDKKQWILIARHLRPSLLLQFQHILQGFAKCEDVCEIARSNRSCNHLCNRPKDENVQHRGHSTIAGSLHGPFSDLLPKAAAV